MGLFKRKKKDLYPESIFKMDEFVKFRKSFELQAGLIVNIKKTDNGFLYDIQIGGECPSIVYDVEEKVILKK